MLQVEQATAENMLRHMRSSCWIPNATNKHSEYVIVIGLPLQPWLIQSALMLRYAYFTCLFHSFYKNANFFLHQV